MPQAQLKSHLQSITPFFKYFCELSDKGVNQTSLTKKEMLHYGVRRHGLCVSSLTMQKAGGSDYRRRLLGGLLLVNRGRAFVVKGMGDEDGKLWSEADERCFDR